MTLHRVAIVGTGGIATSQMQALTAMGERVQVVVAVDVDQARVEAFRAAHGIPRACADVEPMLAAEQPDLVHIATPLPTSVPRAWRTPHRSASSCCTRRERPVLLLDQVDG